MWQAQLLKPSMQPNRLFISDNTLTIDPTSPLINGGHYYVMLDSGTIQDLSGDAYAGTSAYHCTTAGMNYVGTAGNDTITSTAGNDTIGGAAGLDTVIFSSNHTDYTVTPTATGLTVNSTADGTDTLSNIERLHFTDGTLAFDADGNAGEVYRLYKAAFDRTPDIAGLSYWIQDFDSGVDTLQGIASAFIASTEFQHLYGSAGTVTDSAFITLLYNNVLNRTPDQGGFDYWKSQLSGGVTHEVVLTSFSESAENKANVAGAIANGIWYA